VSAAPLDGLPDGFLAERFPRMNRNVEIFPLNVMNASTCFFGGILPLRPPDRIRQLHEPEIDGTLRYSREVSGGMFLIAQRMSPY